MVLVDASGRERRDWLAALEATAAAWEAAYDRQPTDSFAAAASMLATATSDHHDHERVAA